MDVDDLYMITVSRRYDHVFLVRATEGDLELFKKHYGDNPYVSIKKCQVFTNFDQVIKSLTSWP